MVIVEGPDGGGKTSLVTQVCNEFGVLVRPRACTSDNGVDPATLRDWVDNDLSESGKAPSSDSWLYDRYPLVSEPIYGPLIRGRMADGFADLIWLRSRLNILEHDRHSLVVFCLPPEEEVMRNVNRSHGHGTKHLEGVHKNARAIYQQYLYLAVLWQGNSVVWDYTQTEARSTLMESVGWHL